ncbi:hypothetical protein MPER_11876 [Moniliophthora perniciosa FA553]|nr:hypothetical protein MPER_11876 [Moniliophthora perniciosa FA553]
MVKTQHCQAFKEDGKYGHDLFNNLLKANKSDRGGLSDCESTENVFIFLTIAHPLGFIFALPAGGQHLSHPSQGFVFVLFLCTYWKDLHQFKLSDARPKDAFIPFNLGPRECLGRKFFETEGVAILIMLMSRYYIELAPR